jgi:hypothetical protein
MELKMENKVLKDQVSESVRAITQYRNEVRYMHEVIKRMIMGIKTTTSEYNDRMLKVQDIDTFLKTLGGLGSDPYKHDEQKPMKKAGSSRPF